MKTLTLDIVRSFMDTNYQLVYVDYNDNLNNSQSILVECIKEQSAEPLYDHVSDWFTDAEHDRITEIIEELKSTCSEQDYTNEQIEEFFAENEDAIREEIQNRDNSDTLGQLVKNTSAIPIRIEMHSNYDCINSHYFEGQYAYANSYFGDMVDRLFLNPRKVQEVFTKNGLECIGYFPNIEERNGYELVDYQQFAQEIANSVTPANLLTFMATINVAELVKTDFTIGQITIPKGNCCGLYSPSYGGGSIMKMKLKRDVTLSLKGRTQYDYFSIQIDADTERGYALKDVYGVIDSFFGKPAIIHKEDLMFNHLGNGVTVCDRLREKNNDYMTVAHIAQNRKVAYYEPLTVDAIERIEKFASTDNMTTSATQPNPVLKPIK